MSLLRSGRTRTSLRCGAPMTATGSRPTTAKSSRGRCSSRAEPAIGRRCRHSHARSAGRRAIHSVRLPQPGPAPRRWRARRRRLGHGRAAGGRVEAIGTPVILSVGEHVRLPRTYRGRDVLWWMDASGVWDQRYDEVEDLQRARRLPSPQLVGTPERTTLDLNALSAMGVELVGRLAAVRDGRALFSGGLRNVCSLADLKMRAAAGRVRRVGSDSRGADAEVGAPERFAPTEVPRSTRLGLDLRSGEIRAVVWATGSSPTTAGSTCPSSTRRAGSAMTAASSTARASTPSGCPCCGGASPRSSTASRTMRVR